jgi:GNAT superfamily N-acetyltransferase
MSQDIQIVRYEERHREAVRDICLRTGFLGEDLRPRLAHHALFLDLATQFYLEAACDGVFVAEMGGAVAGYIFTVVDAKAASNYDRFFFPRRILRELPQAPRMTADDRKFYLAWVRALLRGEFIFPPTPGYPSTLHLNVPPEFQARGPGVALMTAGLDFLARKGSRGLHLHTTTANKKMTSFARALGFRKLSSRPARLYADFGMFGIKYLVFGKKLGPDAK